MAIDLGNNPVGTPPTEEQKNQLRKVLEVPLVPLTIAVVGDSMAAQSPLFDEMWPDVLQRNLTQNGVPCIVRSFAINAHSAFRCLNTATHGSQTSSDAAIALNPDVVIVPLGYNDAFSKIDGRTLSQVIADYDTLISNLRAALPDALIYYASQTAYDVTHVDPSSEDVLNRHVAPGLFKLDSGDIYDGLYHPTHLDRVWTPTEKIPVTDYQAYDQNARAHPDLDGVFDLNSYKAARLGLLGTDGLHFTKAGQHMLGGWATKGLINNASFTSAYPNYSFQVVGNWVDPDQFFDEYLVSDGTDFVPNQPIVDILAESVRTNLEIDGLALSTWYYPYKSSCVIRSTSDPLGGTISRLSDDALGLYIWIIENSQPRVAIQLSLNGSAFFGTGVVTNERGNYFSTELFRPLATVTGMSTGANTFVFSIGNMAYGPYTFTVNDNLSAVIDDLITRVEALENP